MMKKTTRAAMEAKAAILKEMEATDPSSRSSPVKPSVPSILLPSSSFTLSSSSPQLSTSSSTSFSTSLHSIPPTSISTPESVSRQADPLMIHLSIGQKDKPISKSLFTDDVDKDLTVLTVAGRFSNCNLILNFPFSLSVSEMRFKRQLFLLIMLPTLFEVSEIHDFFLNFDGSASSHIFHSISLVIFIELTPHFPLGDLRPSWAQLQVKRFL